MPDVRDRWAKSVLASRDISRSAKVTAWALREFCNREGVTTVGLRRLAKDTGRSIGAIKNHLDELEAAEFIKRFPGQGQAGRGGRTNLTQLIAGCPESVQVELNASKSESVQFDGESVQFSTESVQARAEQNHTKPVHRTKPGGSAAGSNAGAPPAKTADDVLCEMAGEPIWRIRTALPTLTEGLADQEILALRARTIKSRQKESAA